MRDRPQITSERVLVRRTPKEVDADTGLVLSDLDNRDCRQESPKAGMTATVPLLRPLWRQLVALADQRLREPPLPMPAGRLLFRRPSYSPGHTHSIGVLDNTNFRRDVWIPAREAAGLTGDESLPTLAPNRRYPMKVKDLWAFAASVLLDSGSSLTEAALMLRHSDKRTTERHLARAVQERARPGAARRAGRPGGEIAGAAGCPLGGVGRGVPVGADPAGYGVDAPGGDHGRTNSPAAGP